MNIDTPFFVFLSQLPTHTRDLLVFEFQCGGYCDLVVLTPQGLLDSGLGQDGLDGLRHALAIDGLFLDGDMVGSLRSVMLASYGATDTTSCKAILLTAIRLIDSAQQPVAPDSQAAE